MESRIIFLRHGITEGNKNRWFYGGLDLPLLPEGKEKLRELKKEGLYPEIPETAQYFTTGMIRTRETLETLFGDKEFDIIADLREMEFGEYEAKTFDELQGDPAFESWTYDETGTIKFPGGESRNDFATRVRRGLETLKAQHRLKELELRHKGQPAVTVMICHGGVIAGIMDEIFPGEKPDMWAWMPEPGCGYIVEFDDGEPSGHCQIGETIVY